MQSTLTVPDADPHDTFVIRPEIVPAAAADKESPDPVREVLSLLSHRRAQMASAAPAVASPPAVPAIPAIDPTPAVDTTFRATDTTTGQPSAMGKWTRRVTVGFLFTLGSALAAATWNDHGEAARQMIANWLPPFALVSLPVTEKSPAAEQPASPPTVQAAAADPAPAQPAPSAAAPQAPAPAMTADSTQLLQSMARDLSAIGQQIEQLKTSIEQIKVGQAQMSREMTAKPATKPSEIKPAERPRLSAAAPRPLAPPPRYPRPANYPPAPAAYSSPLPPPASPQPAPSQPAAMPQTSVQPDGEPVVRPPMPLR